MKTNIKLKVTPKQSEIVQKICFANGIEWLTFNSSVAFTDKEYLFIDSNRIWYRGIANHDSGIKTVGYTEVDTDLFIRTNGNCEESIDIVDNLSNNKSKEDMFKQYGFEVPDFDCTILAKVKDDYVGYYVTKNKVIIALSWSSNGSRYIGTTYNPEYNLTPIKQPWYETCKFPVLVWDGDVDNDLLAIETRGEYASSYLEMCKPLSNEEIDQLKQDF